MALYHHGNELAYSGSPVFDQILEPGSTAPYGGIYKCTGCGHEIGIAKYHNLPPQNHHQHRDWSVRIQWRAVVLHP